MAGPRTSPPFRADHVGSLLRPAELAAARARWRQGMLAAEALRAMEDEAIRAVVAMQESVGLRGVTDGEFRRDYWHLDFMFGFRGVRPSDRPYATAFSAGTEFVAPAACVVDRIACPPGGIMTDHFDFLKSVTRRTPKFCIPAPAMFRHRSGRRTVSAEAYPDLEAFWDDLGKAYNAAVKALAAHGCTYLQLDDVNSCVLCDPDIRARIKAQGDDPDRVLATYVRVNNAAIAGRPPTLAVTTHMCRGNFQSEWAARGGYEAVAERFLAGMDVDGFFMEYDTERAGDFRPLRFVPADKFVVLGLVTTKTPALESKDVLKRRIDEAARFVPLERLCVSPQCGFSSTHHGNRITMDDQKRKLALVVELAEEVWGSA